MHEIGMYMVARGSEQRTMSPNPPASMTFWAYRQYVAVYDGTESERKM